MPWISDSKFVTSAKTIARDYETSIVLVSHPKKCRSKKVVLAGGAAYQRFAQTIIWIEHLPESRKEKIKTPCGNPEIEVNRIVHLCKVRNGPGHGLRLGYNFDSSTLCMNEEGIVIKKKK